MSDKVLTVGMAVYKEFESVWATIQGLRANHGDGFDLVVVDNAPESCARTRSVTLAAGGLYVHRPDLAGTSKPRDACFHFARTPWVLVCDSHVAFETGAVEAAARFAAANPDSNDLLAGPIVGDDGVWTSTHWQPSNPPGLWGTWAVHPDLARVWNPTVHRAKGAAGMRAEADAVAPFEVPMMGLGCFMMRKAAWPGFNRLFRGFGGEEGYIHEKVRQLGGRNLCLPRLRWRHRFRDIVDWKHSPQPYPSSTEDHVWNLIVGHLELGIDPAVIRDHFGKKVTPEAWAAMEAQARRLQPFGQVQRPVAPQKLLGVWYSNNAAPPKLLASSLQTIKAAADQSRHPITVVTCPWQHVHGNPFPEVLADLEGKTGHAAIVRQIEQAVVAAVEKHVPGTGNPFDAVVFLEHDVLYPPDYFDRVGDAFALNPAAPVVVNLDYEGLNATGWLKVRERHEPMHQLAMRWDKAVENHRRTKAECEERGWTFLEPDSLPTGGPDDRGDWARIPPRGLAPAVHVNHPKRLTAHGEVVYHQDAAGRTTHPFWGEHTAWWPSEPAPAGVQPATGAGQAACKPCAAAAAEKAAAAKALPAPTTLEEWAERAAKHPSDFHVHVPTLRALADQCETVAEISQWDDKAALVALLASKAEEVYSYAPGPKRIWETARKLAGDRFTAVTPTTPASVAPADLVFLDTNHTAGAVYGLLKANAEAARRYMVVHCTETFGHQGDDGGPGVMHGVRRFLNEHREWTVIRQDRTNHGLLVMSRDERDKATPPGILRKALNFSKALAAHAQDGQRLVSNERWELRMAECLTCPERIHDTCGKCGCPVDKKASWASSECPIGKWGRDEAEGQEKAKEKAA